MGRCIDPTYVDTRSRRNSGMNTSTYSASTQPRNEPVPGGDEDSIPQEPGTDNEWQMEPLKELNEEKGA